MSWIACGMAAVSVVSSLFGDDAENEALKKKQEARISAFKGKEALAEFAISNNNQRAEEIAKQQAGEAVEAGRDVVVAERKAIGQETIRRGEGLTAGRSVERSVDDVIQKGNKAKADVQKKATDAFMQLHTQARDANARELAQVDDAYNNMVAGVDADQSQKSSGSDMLFGAAIAGVSSYVGAGGTFGVGSKIP